MSIVNGLLYIDDYETDSGWNHSPCWHLVKFHGMALDGTAMTFKTRRPHIGDVARQAFIDHVPVTIETNGRWLSKIELVHQEPGIMERTREAQLVDVAYWALAHLEGQFRQGVNDVVFLKRELHRVLNQFGEIEPTHDADREAWRAQLVDRR